jgi:hypothetical protein
LNHRKDQHALEFPIKDCGGLIDAWTSGYEAGRVFNPDAMEEMYVDFVPCARKDLHTTALKTTNLPVQFMACHSWSFLVHPRRVSLLSRDKEKLVVIGVTMKQNMITTTFCPGSMQSHPELDLESEASGDEDDENVLGIHSNDALGVSVKELNGWRVSYRPKDPETATTDMFIGRLTRKMARMSPVLHLIPEGSRHRSAAVIESSARASAVIRNTKLRQRAALERSS